MGDAVGASVGASVGNRVGLALGALVGTPVGAGVGYAVGAAVGDGVGYAVGAEVGDGVGQARVLQTSCCARGHSIPPWWWGVVITTARMRSPTPHDFVHGDQLFQLNTQSTGHGWALQFRISLRSSAAHEAPPWAEAVTTERQREWTPPPHCSVHLPHAAQPECTQSTGLMVGAAVGAGVGETVGAAVASSNVRHFAVDWPNASVQV